MKCLLLFVVVLGWIECRKKHELKVERRRGKKANKGRDTSKSRNISKGKNTDKGRDSTV